MIVLTWIGQGTWVLPAGEGARGAVRDRAQAGDQAADHRDGRRRLKRDGIDSSGVATLMADAGLTNGAFYAHFASKYDLVATTVADQLREQRESLSAVARGRAGVEQYVRAYLSVQHRDNPEDGCPSAALLDEIGRSTDSTRQAYTDGLLAVIDDITARLVQEDPLSARVKTLTVFAMMVGTLQLSRALADRQLATLLDQGVENALTLSDATNSAGARSTAHARRAVMWFDDRFL